MVKHIRQPPTYPSIHRTPHSRPETPETPSPGGMEPSPPTPHFITPGFSLSLPSISLSPGTTNIAPTNPLFRGAAGMVPIAAPTSPSTTAASLQNRSEVDRLEDQIKNEIHRLTETMEREQARHPDRPFSQHARLAELSQLSIHLSRMKAAGQIRSEGFRTLVARARELLLMGAVHHRARNTADGQHIATTTWNYYQAHTHRERMIGIIQDHYPVSSRGIHLEYYDVREEQSPYLPSTDIINNLPIIRTYETLSRSSNSQDQEMARAMSGAVADINNHHPLDETVRLEDLERETHFIHHTYGNPLDCEHPHPLFQFLNRVQETQHRDLENNPGFQARRRLQESLSSIETLHQSLRVLENASSESLPPLALQQTREDLLRRLQVSGQEISQEVNRLEALRQHSHPVHSSRESSEMDGEIEPSPEEVRLRQLQQENTVMQNRVVAMTHNDPHILQNLTEAVRFTLRSDEEQARLLINSELHEANNPELTDEMRRVQTQTGNFSDVGVRLEHYQAIMGQMDTALLQESIRSRIEMYRSILPKIRQGDRIITLASAAQGGTSDFASRYEELIHRYESIGEAVNAGHLDQARHDFIQLEQAQVGQELQDHQVFTGRLQAGLSMGIVAASAATMNAAGLVLLPETALAIEAGESVTLGTRILYTAATTPAFQLAHYAASDVLLGTNNLYDTNQTGAENLERYGEDYIRNFGNNVFIGETLRFVQQAAYARIAERQLIHEGSLASDALRSATELSLIQARAARVAQDGLTSAAVNTAAIVPELAAVQTWGFAERNFSDIYHSRFDLSRATNETLNNTQALQDNALFILGMRVGHLTTSPILGRLHRAAREVALSRVRGRYEAAIEATRTAGQQWKDYVDHGRGDPVEVLRSLESALAARQRLTAHPALRGLVDPRVENQVEQTLTTVRNRLSRENQNATPWTESFRPLIDTMAQWGFAALGPAIGIGGGGIGVRHPGIGRRTRTTGPTHREPIQTTPATSSSTHPQFQIQVSGLVSIIHNIPEAVSTHQVDSNYVEVAVPPVRLETIRNSIIQRSRQLGLRGVAAAGTEDLTLESPNTHERLTIHFTRLQGPVEPTTSGSILPESSNSLATPAYVFARNLQNILKERRMGISPTSYDSHTSRLILKTRAGVDLAREADLVESLIPQSEGKIIQREDFGNRYFLRVRNADGSPLLTIELNRSQPSSQPPLLPHRQNEIPETNRRSRRARPAGIVSSPSLPILETPPPAPLRTLPRTAAGIRTPDALADWFIRRLHILDPATAAGAVLPDNIRYDEESHRVLMTVPYSQMNQAKRYIASFMGGRLVGDSQVSADTRVLRFRTSQGQPEMIVEITGAVSYRNPQVSEETQPGLDIPAANEVSPEENSTPQPLPAAEPLQAAARGPTVQPPPMRSGPHPLTTGWTGVVAPLILGMGGAGRPIFGRRPLPSVARGDTPIEITGDTNQPSTITIGEHRFEIVRATDPNSPESRWTFSNSTLPSGHRWRVVRQGSEVTDPNTLRSGFREGDQVSLVKNSWLGLSETIVGRFIFHDPLAQLPAQAMSTPSPSAQPSRSSPQLPGIESLPVMRRPDSNTTTSTLTTQGPHTIFGRSNIPEAGQNISNQHFTVDYDNDGNMLIRDGAPTQDGNWNLSANGLSVVQQDQTTLFPRHNVPVGHTTPAQRRIATPPIPYTLPPGGRIRLNIAGRFVEINNPTISHSEVPIGDLSIQNSEGGAETLSIRDSSQGFGVLTGQVLVSTRILDANAPNLTVTLHSMNRREQSRFSISREEALARGFITRAGDHYVTNPRLEERMMLLDDSMNVTSQDLERANSLSRRATPAAASTDATVVEPDFGDLTNPNMALPAFVNINPSVNLITVGGQAPTFPTMTNVNLPRLTPQTIPPVIFRRSDDGHTWNVNIQEGNVVLINGHLVDSGSEIHMNDRLQIVTRVEGHTLTHNGRITDRGLEIEGSTQTQEGDSTLQTAARGPTVETPPRRRN